MTAEPKPDSQCARILAVLADGKPKTVPTIHRRAGTMRLNSRIAELRSRYGHDIVCERLPHRKGASAYRYTWVDAPGLPEEEESGFTLDTDTIAPRVPSERYRIFRVRNGGPPEIHTTVGSKEAVGVALCELGEEGEFDDYCIGVQDSMGRWDDQRQKWVGKWLVKPWQAAS